MKKLVNYQITDSAIRKLATGILKPIKYLFRVYFLDSLTLEQQELGLCDGSDLEEHLIVIDVATFW